MGQTGYLEKKVRIDSRACKDLDDWRKQVEKVLERGDLPVIQNFDRDTHLDGIMQIALSHNLTVLLNPQQTECQFRRRP